MSFRIKSNWLVLVLITLFVMSVLVTMSYIITIYMKNTLPPIDSVPCQLCFEIYERSTERRQFETFVVSARAVGVCKEGKFGGSSPLENAACLLDFEALESLLELEDVPHWPIGGMGDPLHMVVDNWSDNPDNARRCFELLIKHGADDSGIVFIDERPMHQAYE